MRSVCGCVDVHQERRVRGREALRQVALADAHAQLVHVVGAEARAREQGVRQLPAAQHRPPRVVAQLA